MCYRSSSLEADEKAAVGSRRLCGDGGVGKSIHDLKKERHLESLV